MTAKHDFLATAAAYLLGLAPLFAIWEVAQLPLYTIWHAQGPSASLVAAMHCTLGDLVLALAAVSVGFLVARRVVKRRSFAVFFGVALSAGVLMTIAIEWVSTIVLVRWAYAPEMPQFAGIGLSPLVQWVTIPSLGLLAHADSFRRALERTNLKEAVS